MNRLDERLKERARREDCPVPQGFDGRMNAILEGLPEGRRKPGPVSYTHLTLPTNREV
mgnify:CR=1 FL=1